MGRIKDACCVPYKETAEDRKRRERWAAEADLDTMISAARIKKDSKRFKAAIAVANEKKAEMAAVTKKDLKSS